MAQSWEGGYSEWEDDIPKEKTKSQKAKKMVKKLLNDDELLKEFNNLMRKHKINQLKK